jgi:uncharacterized GH25 family protein
MKKIILTLVSFLILPLLFAHEFWLESTKFFYAVGETITINLFSGEGFKGDKWKGDHYKTNTIKLYRNDSAFDISSTFSKKDGEPIKLKAESNGTQIITFNNINKYIELKPKEFTAYLKEDGITEALDYRTKNNELEKNGKEYYQRSVKTLIQIGKNFTEDYKKETSLILDIIPLQNPYDLKNEKSLNVKVLFKKEALANHMLKVWYMHLGKLKHEDIQTNDQGEITIPITKVGKYMISTVKMIRLENDAKADWQSYWASLTFGYEK